MATTITKTIITAGGGDYSTVQAWEDAIPADLVTADEVWVGQFTGSDVGITFNVPTVDFSAHTSDATRYWRLEAASGQGVHASASNAIRFNASLGAALNQTGGGGGGRAILISGVNHFFQIYGIQARSDASRGLDVQDTCNGLLVERCVFQSASSSAEPALFLGDDGVVRLTYFICNHATPNICQMGSSAMDGYRFDHCAFVRPSNHTAGGFAVDVSGGTNANHVFINCFFGGVAAGSLDTFTNVTATFCGSTATIGGGSDHQPSLTYADQFENPDASSGTHDFRMKAGADIDGAGTATLTTDFFGVTFETPPAIGPMELAGGAPATQQRLMLTGVGS